MIPIVLWPSRSWTIFGWIPADVGLSGFLGYLEEFRASSDEESMNWLAFVNAWWSRFGNREVAVGDLFETAMPLLDLGAGSKQSQATRLGTALAGQRDRVYGGYRVKRRGVVHGYRMWRLEARPR